MEDLRQVGRQKDVRVREVENLNSEMRNKLANVLEKAYWPSQVEILKVLP